MNYETASILAFLALLGLGVGGWPLFFSLVMAAAFCGLCYGIIILLEKRYDGDDTSS